MAGTQLQVSVDIANTKLTRATRLDSGGYRAEDVPVSRENGRLHIELPPNTMYMVLAR